jgi:hypothetical protein
LILLLLETEPGKAEISSTVADEEGFQIVSQDNIGLMFPRFDNLNARHRTQQVGGFTSRSELAKKRSYCRFLTSTRAKDGASQRTSS